MEHEKSFGDFQCTPWYQSRREDPKESGVKAVAKSDHLEAQASQRSAQD